MAETKVLYALGAEFDSAAALMKAAEKVRDAGYKRWDVHTPFPVHGMDAAMGLKKSFLGKFVFVGGLLGFLTGVSLVTITSFQLYPINVHGKPTTWLLPGADSPLEIWGLGAIHFFFPIIYELTILFSAFAAVGGMILFNGLPCWWHPVFEWERFYRVTDDGFFLVIEARDPNFSETRTRALLEEVGGQNVVPIVAKPAAAHA
jgi:hypothetical protein